MKKAAILMLALTLVLTLGACSDESIAPTAAAFATRPASASEKGAAPADQAAQTVEILPSVTPVAYDADDLDVDVSESGVSTIRLEGDSIALDGNGATVEGSIVTITSAGTYHVSGTLNDGQIRVNTEDKETVRLVLNGADLACSTCAPLYILQADKAVITLAEGTENTVTDGEAYVLEDAAADEPNAAIFSKDDLTINGSGSLTVHAFYNNGIASKDDLKIAGGSITVHAANDGIKGRDSVAVKDGAITIHAGGDGMQATNDEDAEKGTIAIEGGTLAITAGLDAIQAQTRLVVSGGQLTLSSGGGSANSSSSGGGGGQWGSWGAGKPTDDSDVADSAKGLKAGVDVTITGGTIHIDSSDDAIHSNNSVAISGGEMTLTSGDDGIHADATLGIYGGDLTITQSYEGIESAVIAIQGGNLHIVASDDGINVAGGKDGSSIRGRPGQNSFASGDRYLAIDGGYIVVDATGDGLDINGAIRMTQGVVIVNGPTANNNGALDYDGGFVMTGGLLVAAGSAGMAQAPDPSSTQYAVMQTFESVQAAGTMVHIETEDGKEILTFVPTHATQSVVLSSPELENGVTYVVYTGGSSTGTVTDGLYAGGTYTAGSKVDSFTISSMVTGADASRGRFPGRPGGNRGRPGG